MKFVFFLILIKNSYKVNFNATMQKMWSQKLKAILNQKEKLIFLLSFQKTFYDSNSYQTSLTMVSTSFLYG